MRRIIATIISVFTGSIIFGVVFSNGTNPLYLSSLIMGGIYVAPFVILYGLPCSLLISYIMKKLNKTNALLEAFLYILFSLLVPILIALSSIFDESMIALVLPSIYISLGCSLIFYLIMKFKTKVKN
ncbi:hypothetical protein [Priestia megaterium]|uniref:hypothetical protein n=1 Tax=Priestia megaterium TaxID=1404 RepID=UPI003D2C9492